MFKGIIKRTKRGSLNFIIIVIILVPIILLPMTKLIINSYQVQNNIVKIAEESNRTNSIFEIALYKSLNYLDGITLSDFNDTRLENEVSNAVTANIKDLEILVLVDESLENGEIQLNLDVDNKTTLVLKIENIQLTPIYEEIEVEKNIFEDIIVDYDIDIENYTESRWVK